MQASVSRAALRHLGIAGTLALRPALTAASALLGVALPRFATATLARGAHETLTNSLFRSAYELLYTPLPEAEKRRAKAVVDVAVDKLGALLGSGTIALVLALVPAAAASVLFAVAAAGSLAALGLSRRLHRGYVRTLEQSLILGRVRLDADEILDQATQVTLANTSLIERGTLLRQIEELRGSQRDSLVSPPTRGPAHLLGLRGQGSLRPGRARRPPRLGAVGGPRPRAPGAAAQPGARARPRRLPPAAPRLRGAVRRRRPGAAARGTSSHRAARGRAARPRRRSHRAPADPARAQGLPHAAGRGGPRAALDDPSFEIRASAAAALAALHERSPFVRIAREEVLGRVRRELDSGEPVDRQLPQLFALLSLTLERGPLQIAWAAMKGQDRDAPRHRPRVPRQRPARRRLPAHPLLLRGEHRAAPPPRRPVEQVADELRASSMGLRIEQPPWREGGEG